MDWSIAVGVDSIESHFDYTSNSIFVNMMHREGFDVCLNHVYERQGESVEEGSLTVLLQDLLLFWVHIAQSDVDKSFSLQDWLDPGVLGYVSAW